MESARWYDAFYRDEDYAWESTHLTTLIRERCPDATSLLDVGCGSGRHLVHLAEEFDCTGVDLDESALALARCRLPRRVRLHHADMETLALGQSYDAITCLFSAIGFMTTRARLRRAIATMGRHLSPGGVLVIEPWYLDDTWGDGPEPTVEEVRIDGQTLVRTIAITRKRDVSRLHIHYAYAGQTGIRTADETNDLGVFSRADYTAAMTRVGLDVEVDPVGLSDRGLFIGTA
jgi:SAM-dependent methyltransferase